MPKPNSKSLTKVRSKSDKAAKPEKRETKEIPQKDKSRSKSQKKDPQKTKKTQNKKGQVSKEGENTLKEKGDIKIDIRTTTKAHQNPHKIKESKSPQKIKEKSKKSLSQEAKKAKNVGRDEKKEIKKEKKTEEIKKEQKKHLDRSRSKDIKKEKGKIKTKKPEDKKGQPTKTPEKSAGSMVTPVTPSSTYSARSSSKSKQTSRSRSKSPQAVVVSATPTPEMSRSRDRSSRSNVALRPASREFVESEKRQKEIAEVKRGTIKAARKKPTQKKRQSIKKVQEISSENLESSSSIDLALEQKKHKTDVSYAPNFKNEIKEAIAKIEKKRQSSSQHDYIHKKRKRGDQVALRENVHTAADFDFILQKNPNSKIKPIVDLVTLSSHKLINYSDVLLAMIEVANNANNYLFAYSAKSKSFWNDILQYKVLKKIFTDFKAETLRKYWVELSKHDPQTATDLIKKHKKYLDNLPLKLGTIVTSISKYLDGKIKNFQEYINNIQVDIRKREVFEHEFKNPVTGDITKIRDVRTIYNTRRKYEPGKQKNFNEPQINIIALQEIYQHTTKKTDYQNVMQKLYEEDNTKFDYLNEYKDEQKKILQSINESHKFIFKTVDNVLEVLCKEFSNYSKDFILEMLQQNSMDVTKTYLCLKDPKKAKELAFTPLDDKVILNMKNGEEFKILLNEKGKAAISEREEYLKGN